MHLIRLYENEFGNFVSNGLSVKKENVKFWFFTNRLVQSLEYELLYMAVSLSASFSRSPCWPTLQWTAVHLSTCHLTSSGSPTCHPDCGFHHL